MTTEITVNRNIFYLSIDNFRIETPNGYFEHEDKFVAFIKNTSANIVVVGEQIKSEDGKNIVFISRQEATDYVVDKLKKSTYPPDFLHPTQYTKENLSEIKDKQLIFDITKDAVGIPEKNPNLSDGTVKAVQDLSAKLKDGSIKVKDNNDDKSLIK